MTKAFLAHILFSLSLFLSTFLAPTVEALKPGAIPKASLRPKKPGHKESTQMSAAHDDLVHDFIWVCYGLRA